MTEQPKRKRGRPQYGERKVSIHLSILPSDLATLEKINPGNISEAFRQVMNERKEQHTNG